MCTQWRKLVYISLLPDSLDKLKTLLVEIYYYLLIFKKIAKIFSNIVILRHYGRKTKKKEISN